MLRSVAPIVKQILKEFPNGGADLENIERIVIGVTHIDRVHYTAYDVPPDNPFLGSFRRIHQRDAVYAPFVTIVDIRYAQHLAEAVRRFVVCKELCHSLEAPRGEHVVSDEGIDDLVAAFAIESAGEQLSDHLEYGIEVLAMTSAIEVLCPLPCRLALMKKYGPNLNHELVARDFGLPSAIPSVFSDGYTRLMTSLYKQYGIDL